MSTPPQAQLTKIVSWAPSGWLVRGVTTTIDTDFITLCCPDDFVAIRAGFTNISSSPYAIDKVIAAASTTLGDAANPTGNVTWTPLTFLNGGVDADSIVAQAGAPTQIMVQGCRPGAASENAAIPSWTWSDWVPLPSVARTDSPGAPRVLMLRVLLPAGCNHTRPNGGFLEYHASPDMNSRLRLRRRTRPGGSRHSAWDHLRTGLLPGRNQSPCLLRSVSYPERWHRRHDHRR